MNKSTALIQESLERYQNAIDRLVAGMRPGDGILGFGNDPKRAPYHMDFYRDVEQVVRRLEHGEWPEDQPEETVEFLLTMGENFGDRLTQPMMEAAQGHVLPLIPQLTGEQAERLARSHADRYPRRQRLPIQEKVLVALERRARER